MYGDRQFTVLIQAQYLILFILILLNITITDVPAKLKVNFEIYIANRKATTCI